MRQAIATSSVLLLALTLVPVAARANDSSLHDFSRDYGLPDLSQADFSLLETGEPWVQVRELDGSDIKVCHVVALMPFTQQQVRNVIFDLPRFAEFIPDLIESTVIERDVESGYAFRSGLDLPWPVSNRHWTVRVRLFETEVDGTRVYVNAFNHIAGTGNINSSRGRWAIWPDANDPERTYVSYFVHTDPGGWIPDFLVNFAAQHLLPGLMKVVRKRVAALLDGDVSAPELLPLTEPPSESSDDQES